MDILSPEQRSKRMASIQGRDTVPEMRVRRLVHALGYRYRLQGRHLPGTPDLVFTSRGCVLFVHGCYWHRHSCRQGRSIPSTRTEFWTDKFEANVSRDRRVQAKLRRAGWRVMVVWECQTRDLDRLSRRLERFLEQLS